MSAIKTQLPPTTTPPPACFNRQSAIGNRQSTLRARGFSFTELLFATMLLGIGFILIAAIFPVAATQTRATQDEITAASIARGMADTIRSLASSSTLPVTNPTAPPGQTIGQVRSLVGPQITGAAAPSGAWERVKAQSINVTDGRYGVVAFYKRDADAPFAQLITIVTRAQRQTLYDTADLTVPMGAEAVAPPGLGARPMEFAIYNNYLNSGIDVVRIRDLTGTSGLPDFIAAPADFGFLIVADDLLPAGDRGRFNGLILRLGRERTDFPELAVGERAFELAPGFEWIPAGDPDGNNSARNAIPTLPMPTGSWNNVVVNNATPYVPNAGSAAWPRGFVVGRAITNYQITSPYQPTFTGAAQDIACYTTIIPVN